MKMSEKISKWHLSEIQRSWIIGLIFCLILLWSIATIHNASKFLNHKLEHTHASHEHPHKHKAHDHPHSHPPHSHPHPWPRHTHKGEVTIKGNN